MKLTEGKIAKNMFVEIMQVIERYDGTLFVPTVLGVLEVAKMEVIKASLREGDDDDETN
jgi:hypothetical protein